MPLRSDMVSHEVELTSEEWDGVELLPPVVGDLDAAVVSLALSGFVSLAIGMEDKLGHIVRVDSIQHVEVIGAVGLATLGQSVWEEVMELGVVLELLPKFSTLSSSNLGTLIHLTSESLSNDFSSAKMRRRWSLLSIQSGGQ